MAKRTTTPKSEPKTSAPKPSTNLETAKVTATSPVRKTVAPKKAAKAAAVTPMALTHERIAERAYFIAKSGNGGSEIDNWHRAERELRDGV
ncbi:MAG TPA: DUF2934 domain-containing protein [Tepidisphaeraceae bacterium]|jgi:hypothetical protein